jgi:predicted transcriptional regulator
MGKNATIKWTAKIVTAYTASHAVSQDQVATLVSVVHAALLEAKGTSRDTTRNGSSSAHQSVTPDYIISLESGRRLKTLKRYLMAKYGLTPDEYRQKWGLPKDYPMVAPSYSEKRRYIAVTNGLGKFVGRSQ